MRSTPFLFFLLLAAAAGCGDVQQRPACADYVACVQARDLQSGTSTNVDRFDVGGGCWGGDTGADLCETGCVQGLEFLRERQPDLPAECM